MNLAHRFCCIPLLCMLLPMLPLHGQQKKIVVGILPPYDLSGQSYGPRISQMLTTLLFEEYAANPRFTPLYLNPGGVYDPTSTSFAAEYAQTLDTPVDLLLATTFVEPEEPKHGDLILHLKASQLDPKTGEPKLTWTASKPVKDRSAMISTVQNSAYANKYVDAHLLYEPSREVRKQPLGKAAADLAAEIVRLSAADAANLPATGDAVTLSPSASCTMRLKVNYESKHAISKSYTVYINDRDETQGVKEGLLDVEEKQGRLAIMLKVNDKPYKLAVQDAYLFDPLLDCSRQSNFLNVNIGPAGEAHTVWR